MALFGTYSTLEPRIRNETLNISVVLVVLVSSIAYRRLRRAYRARQARRKRKGFTLGFDVDGVLGDQIAGVLPRIKEKFGIDLDYQDVTDWRLPVASSDIAVEIEQAVKDPSYVLRMPVHAGAKETLDDLFPHHGSCVRAVGEIPAPVAGTAGADDNPRQGERFSGGTPGSSRRAPRSAHEHRREGLHLVAVRCRNRRHTPHPPSENRCAGPSLAGRCTRSKRARGSRPQPVGGAVPLACDAAAMTGMLVITLNAGTRTRTSSLRSSPHARAATSRSGT